MTRVGAHVLVFLGAASVLFLAACGSSESAGKPYSVGPTRACLKRHPGYVRAGGVAEPSSQPVVFAIPPTEYFRSPKPPAPAPLEVGPEGGAEGVDPLPVGTWMVGVIFRNPKSFQINSASIYFLADEKTARHAYNEEQDHIDAFGKDGGINFHLDKVIQHNRNVMVVWGIDDAPSSWIRIVSGCLMSSP